MNRHVFGSSADRSLLVLTLLLASAAVVTINAALTPAAGRVKNAIRALDGDQTRPRNSCFDEKGGIFSPGSLRRVAGQIQKCDAGKWILNTPNAARSQVSTKSKTCRDARDQEYDAGVFRSIGAKVEKCDNGKWITKPGSGKEGR